MGFEFLTAMTRRSMDGRGPHRGDDAGADLRPAGPMTIAIESGLAASCSTRHAATP